MCGHVSKKKKKKDISRAKKVNCQWFIDAVLNFGSFRLSDMISACL